MDIVDRIFRLADQRFQEQKDFAAALGIDQNLPSRWRNRKSTSYQKRLPQIAKALGTTTEYLLTGKDAAFISDLTEEERQFLQAYRRADEHTRQIVRLTLAPFGLTLHE